MGRFSCRLLVLGAVLLFLTLTGQDGDLFAQNSKKDDPPSKSDKTEEKNPKKGPKIVRVGTYAGKLLKLEEDSFQMEVTVGKYKQTVDIVINDDVKVRMPFDLDFDDKGKPKRPKKDPNDKDSRLGGGRAREDLANGQEIVVTVGALAQQKLIATIVKVVKKVDK